MHCPNLKHALGYINYGLKKRFGAFGLEISPPSIVEMTGKGGLWVKKGFCALGLEISPPSIVEMTGKRGLWVKKGVLCSWVGDFSSFDRRNDG